MVTGMRTGMQWFLVDLWEGLQTRRGRTGLALFAIGVGMVSLTILVAVLGGLQRRSHQIVGELGAQVIAVTQNGSPGQGQRQLNLGMADVLGQSLPGCRLSVVRHHRVPVLGSESPLPVLATDEHLADLRQWSMRDGRWLDHTDVGQHQRNAVISEGLADARGWSRGQILLVKDTPFTIVGVCRTGGNRLSGVRTAAAVHPGEHAIFVPVTVQPFWDGQEENRSGQVDALFIQAPAQGDIYAFREAAQQILQSPSLAAGPLSWLTPDLLLAGLRGLQRTVRATAGSISCLCLILGGTTLMSLMVASVRERVHEIGLRQSLGATPRDIALLFAMEACVITLIAAVAGTAVGHLLLWAMAGRLPVPIALGPASVIIPIGSSLVLGMLFAYAPARNAATITPSEALRNA